jgi:hypothetical protein
MALNLRVEILAFVCSPSQVVRANPREATTK